MPTGEEKGDEDANKRGGGKRRLRGHRRRRSLRAAFSRLFGWLVTVVTIPDAVLLESAGLDALVLTWCFKLGMQVRDSFFESFSLSLLNLDTHFFRFQNFKKLKKQIFFPLALVALFVLLPVNILGQGVKQGVLSSAAAAAAAAAASNSTLAFHSPTDANATKAAKAADAADARPGFTSFSRFTLTNLPQGSPLHWFAFVFVHLSTFWTLFLLRRYNRA